MCKLNKVISLVSNKGKEEAQSILLRPRALYFPARQKID